MSIFLRQAEHMMIWSKPETVDQGSVTVTVANRDDLFADLRQRFDANQGFSVATLNLDHVVKLSKDPLFQTAYSGHSHITADGNPIVWLSRLAGQRDVSLVPGSELIEPLAAIAAEKNIGVAFLGSTEASLEQSARELKRRYPGLDIRAMIAPPMGFDPDGPAADAAIAQLRDSGARLVFLALGAPKQERFAARAQTELAGAGFLSIGAGLDFISGSQQRAPVWVRRLAAEWLWRMLSNPRRLAARYGACLMILPRLTLRALSARRQIASRG